MAFTFTEDSPLGAGPAATSSVGHIQAENALTRARFSEETTPLFILKGYYNVTSQFGTVGTTAGGVTFSFNSGAGISNRNFTFSVPVLSGGTILPAGRPARHFRVGRIKGASGIATCADL